MDFQEAQNTLQYLQDQRKIPIKIAHKLELLQECINEQVIDTSMYHSLEMDECQSLMKLNKQAQMDMFMQIIKGLAVTNMLPSAIGIIEGEIDVRTKVLKNWKAKKFKIDSKQRTFEILRKKSSKKKPRQIYLQYYTVQPQEYKEKRYRFVITANSEGHGYYKQLVCGSEDKKLYDKVMEALKTISQFKDHIMRGSVLLSDNNEWQRNALNQQSFITQRADMKLVTQSEIIPQKQNIVIKKEPETKPQLVQSQVQTVVQVQQPIQQPIQQTQQQQQIIQPTSQIIQPTQQIIQPTQQQTQQIINEQLKQQQIQQEQIEQQQKYQQQQILKRQEELRQQQLYLQQQQLQLQQEQEELERNKYQSPSKSPEIIIQPQKIEVQPQKIEVYQPKLEVQQPKIEVQQPKPQKIEIQQTKIEIQQPPYESKSPQHTPCKSPEINEQPLKYPGLLQILYEEGKLNSDYFTQPKQFSQVYSRDGIQILKAQDNSLCFRSILTIASTNMEIVFQSLAEIEFVKKWNAVLNPLETKLLNIMQSESFSIIYERHKPYGLLYLPRDYVYLRYVAYRGNDIIIVDKSIENEDAPPYLKVIRGEINYQITEIIQQENNILVRIESEITNGGLSSANQDSAITQWYLTELSHVNAFIKTYSAQHQIIQSPLLQMLQKTKKQPESLVIDKQIEIIQLEKQVILDKPIESPSQQQQVLRIPEAELPQPSPVTAKFDKFEFTVEQLPVIATVPEAPPVIIQQVNEIQQYNQQIEEADLSTYIPSDFIQQTLPELSDDEMQQVKRMIKNIEQGTFDYTANCIKHKYIQEPFQMKDDYIKQIDGGHYFLRQDWKRDMKHGGMIFYNAKKIEAQKRVIKFMLKSIGSNLLSGKSILNISLPVEVFESRSNLERFCYSFTFAPQILEKGAKIDNAAEQMKYSIAFGCSSIIMYMSLEKPFNPILGETYQGFINGCPVYAEQVSHHPPISAFQLKGRGYDIDGHIESAASMHANSVTGKNIGFIRVTYHNTKAKHIFIQCPGVLTGTAFGTRVFNINGRSYTIDLENNLIADMAFNPGNKNVFNKKDLLQDQFIGYVYKVKNGVLNKYRKEGYAKYTGIDFDKDVEQRLYNINGIWNQMVEFDGMKLFDTLEMYPHTMVNHPCPLPSDSNFRLDVLYWKLRDFNNSQRTKEIYEIKQRGDRKSREKFTGKKH